MKAPNFNRPLLKDQQNTWPKVYRFISLWMAILFFIVGLTFLFMADRVLAFFNTISGYVGMVPSPVQGLDIYLILAVGYMYLVALIAGLMYRHPDNIDFPWLLINGKSASSVLSMCLFIFHQPYLIYITNGIVDGMIALVVLFFYRKLKKIPA